MSAKDTVIPFTFEAMSVRGALVQMESSWQRMQQDHNYESLVADTLGQAAAATALIAQSLKFDGSITLQIMGDGPLTMLVMQCTDKLDVRGMASAQETGVDMTFADLTKNSRCAVTVDAGAMEKPYQGIVAIDTQSLAASLEHYFERSVQVPSHLVLVSGASYCGGLLVQQMPGEEPPGDDDWRRLGYLLATLRIDDLAEGATPRLLHQVFAEDDVRVFTPKKIQFRCRCSANRVEEVLRMLGQAEAEAALNDDNQVTVTCEYCGRARRFDAVDVKRIFADQVHLGSSSIH